MTNSDSSTQSALDYGPVICIRKKHIGRPVDFLGSKVGIRPINGRIEGVKNKVATIRYHLVLNEDGSQDAYSAEGFVAYLPVDDKRILEVL